MYTIGIAEIITATHMFLLHEQKATGGHFSAFLHVSAFHVYMYLSQKSITLI